MWFRNWYRQRLAAMKSMIISEIKFFHFNENNRKEFTILRYDLKLKVTLPQAVIALVMAFASRSRCFQHARARACGSSQTIRRSKLS